MDEKEAERKKLGASLARAREAAELTQLDVAERLGLAKQTISAQEKGRNIPDALLLAKLASIYRIGVDELLGAAPQSESAALARRIDAIADPDARAGVLKLCNDLVDLQVRDERKSADVPQQRVKEG